MHTNAHGPKTKGLSVSIHVNPWLNRVFRILLDKQAAKKYSEHRLLTSADPKTVIGLYQLSEPRTGRAVGWQTFSAAC